MSCAGLKNLKSGTYNTFLLIMETINHTDKTYPSIAKWTSKPIHNQTKNA